MNREQARASIEANIRKFGFHLYVVTSGVVPRFAYTIGLSKDVGFELAMPGSIWFFVDELRDVVGHVAATVRRDSSALSIGVARYGHFHIRRVHPTWNRLVLTGAIDYYGHDVAARQIVPDASHITVDTPDLSLPFKAAEQPIWRWRSEKWPYALPSKTEVCTDIAALQGARITQVHYLDVGEWEMFSKESVTREEARMIPFATLLGADDSIGAALSLQVGQSLWRAADEVIWHEWNEGPGSDDALFDATKTKN